MYQAQLDQLQQQTFNMEQTAMVTENLKNTASIFRCNRRGTVLIGMQSLEQMATVDAMKMANKEMKKQYGKIDIDKIEVCNCATNSACCC